MEWTEIPAWMTFAVVTLAVVIGLVIVAVVVRSRSAATLPYARRPAVMSPAEFSFFGVLQQAVDEQVLVLAKVRVADALTPRKNLRKRRARAALTRVSEECFDFILCAQADARPLVAIELDEGGRASNPDRANGRSNGRTRRDRHLDEICAAAGLGLLHVQAADSYLLDELQAQLRPYLQQGTGSGELTPDGRREPVLDLPWE